MRKWGVWVLIAGLAVLAAYQWTELKRLQAAERGYAEKSASLFPYTLRRADYVTLPDVMEDLAEEDDLEAKIALFKQSQALAVAFTDDLLMLNDLRYSGPPLPGAGVQYGDYVYRPATPEQKALQWKILQARIHTTLWSMERKFYVDEGVMQPSDREALAEMTSRVRLIGQEMELIRDMAGQPTPEAVRSAAQAMERLSPMLEELEDVAQAYQAALPSLEPKPGGLYDRLYGNGKGG